MLQRKHKGDAVSFVLWFVIPLIWMLLASVTGLVAERRGYDFHEYYWMALMLPVISLLLLFVKRPEPVAVAAPRIPGCAACGEPLLAGAESCSMCGASLSA